jgi:hypothetical protein
MISRMIKKSYLPVILVTALLLISLNTPTESYGFEIDIDVAPATLNIQSQGQVVTVHTSIAYWAVDHDNVYLNDILISSWKADNQGNFVAKFLMTEVKALADSGDLEVPGENVLSLLGYTTDGAEFTGSEVITVIDVEPAGAGGK